MSHGIIVVDMLRGFLEPASGTYTINTMGRESFALDKHALYCGDDSRKIIPNIVNLLDSHAEAGEKVYFVCDSHDEYDDEFKMFPMHCVTGTEEAEVIHELSSFLTKDNYFPKTRYSGFYNTRLEEYLLRDRITDLTIVGVCTDICVMHTTADARNRGYKVKIPKSCVASFNQDAHEFALDHMQRVLGAEVI